MSKSLSEPTILVFWLLQMSLILATKFVSNSTHHSILLRTICAFSMQLIVMLMGTQFYKATLLRHHYRSNVLSCRLMNSRANGEINVFSHCHTNKAVPAVTQSFT